MVKLVDKSVVLVLHTRRWIFVLNIFTIINITTNRTEYFPMITGELMHGTAATLKYLCSSKSKLSHHCSLIFYLMTYFWWIVSLTSIYIATRLNSSKLNIRLKYLALWQRDRTYHISVNNGNSELFLNWWKCKPNNIWWTKIFFMFICLHVFMYLFVVSLPSGQGDKHWILGSEILRQDLCSVFIM